MEKNSIKLDISLFLILKVIGILLLVYFLFLIRDVLVILGISFILSAALEPVVDKLQKKFRMPRWLGVLTIYALFIAILYVFISMVAPVLNEQIRNLIANRDNYSQDIDRMIASWPVEVQDKVREAVRAIPDEIRSWRVGDISDRAFGIFSGIGSFVAILVISAYILSLKNGMKQTVSAFVPEERRELFLKIFSEITRKMSLWFRGQLLLSLTVGVVTFIGLTIMGIPYALILAIIAAFTELIPIIGPILGAVPAVIVALFVSPLMAVIVGAFYVFVQQLENHILVPQVMRKAVGLNPVIIISSMLIGAKLLGILGVILAVPVASSISVVIRQWPSNNSKLKNKA